MAQYAESDVREPTIGLQGGLIISLAGLEKQPYWAVVSLEPQWHPLAGDRQICLLNYIHFFTY